MIECSLKAVRLPIADHEQSEFPDFGCVRRTQNVESYARGRARRKTFDSFVTNGMAFENGLPAIGVPNLNSKRLHVLTVVQALHQSNVIESYRFGEINLQNGVVRSGGRGPEGVWIGIEGAS